MPWTMRARVCRTICPARGRQTSIRSTLRRATDPVPTALGRHERPLGFESDAPRDATQHYCVTPRETAIIPHGPGPGCASRRSRRRRQRTSWARGRREAELAIEVSAAERDVGAVSQVVTCLGEPLEQGAKDAGLVHAGFTGEEHGSVLGDGFAGAAEAAGPRARPVPSRRALSGRR